MSIDDEEDAVGWLSDIVKEDHRIARAILDFPWIQDDVSDDEKDAVAWLRDIVKEDHRFARAIRLAKSGSSSVEPGDGLRWAEGAAFGSQGHGHLGRKPSLEAREIRCRVDLAPRHASRKTSSAQGVNVLILVAVNAHDAGCSQCSSDSRNSLATLGAHTVLSSGWSADSSRAPGSPPQWLYPLSASDHCPLHSPQGSQLLPDIIQPGYNQPIRHRPKSAAGSPIIPAIPAFFLRSPPPALPVPLRHPSTRADIVTSGWFPLTRTR